MVKVAHRVSKDDIPVVKNGYLYCPGKDCPIPLGTESFDYWFRHSPRFRVVIPDGSGRWVGAKKDKGLIVLQKRVKGKLFQTSCGRSYSGRFLPSEYLEQRAIDLAEKITAEVGEWGNRFSVSIPSQAGKPKSPKLFRGNSDKRAQSEQEQILQEGKLEYLILDCGQGYQFTARDFHEFFEGKFPLDQIKAAIGRQRAAGNIIRLRNGCYRVAEM